MASEDEGLAEEVRRLAEESPGKHNEALVVRDDAHAHGIFKTDEGDRLMDAILGRLRRYR